MRNKIPKAFFAILVFLALGFTLFYLMDYNKSLTNQITQRDILISQMQANDTLYTKTIENYSKTLNQYFQNRQFIINGNKVRTDEIMNLLSRTLKLADTLAEKAKEYKGGYSQAMDSLNHYKKLYEIETLLKQAWFKAFIDSYGVYKVFHIAAKEKYGIDFTYVKGDSSKTMRLTFSKADSAILLYDYFKKRYTLKYDSVGRGWRVIGD
jgi:hypothetical protein